MCGAVPSCFGCLSSPVRLPLTHDPPPHVCCCRRRLHTCADAAHLPMSSNLAAYSHASRPACASLWSPRRRSVLPQACCWYSLLCCLLAGSGCCLQLICADAVLVGPGHHVVGVWGQTGVSCALAALREALLLAAWTNTDTRSKFVPTASNGAVLPEQTILMNAVSHNTRAIGDSMAGLQLKKSEAL